MPSLEPRPAAPELKADRVSRLFFVFDLILIAATTVSLVASFALMMGLIVWHAAFGQNPLANFIAQQNLEPR